MITTARRAARLVVRAARDIGHVIAGRTPDGHRAGPRAMLADLRDYVAAAWRTRTGDLAAAAPRAERLLKRHPDLWVALLVRSAWLSRCGEPSAALEVTKQLRTMADSRLLRRREAELADRLLETEPTWLPEVAVEPGRVVARNRTAILHLLKASLPDRQSGYTIRSRETLRAQVEAGLEPFVVTPFGYPPASIRRGVPDVEVVDGISHHRLSPGADLSALSQTDQLSRTATLAAEVVRRERPAILHVASGHRGYEYALVAAAIKARLRVPMVYEVRGFLEESWTADERIVPIAASAELTRRRLATELRMMSAADGVTTLGSGMRDELVARGVPGAKIVVVPNGIDAEAFQPTAADPELRNRYRLGDRWVFGYVSNMDHFREGHAVLIEAAGRLVAAGRAVALLLVGDGRLRSQLEASVAAAGLRETVVFTGRVPHDAVAAHYALLDAFVVARMADRASQFVTPLKPYEAMAMGIPLVVSDLPALTEIAAPGIRGQAFPVGDAAALQAVLEGLIDHADEAARLAAAARAWVIRERVWRANGIRYRELYEAILARDLPPA